MVKNESLLKVLCVLNESLAACFKIMGVNYVTASIDYVLKFHII